MDSSIIFLGTGTAGAANTNQRSASGILIQTQGFQFVIDPGPGSLMQMGKCRTNIRQTTAILVSHAHVNHCSDANAVISAMTHGGLDPRGVVIGSKSFVDGTEELSAGITNFHKGCVEKIIVPNPGQKIGIGDVEIHALDTLHSDPTALGFKLFTHDFVLSYSGDTGYSKEIAEQYAQSDILILNVPFESKQSENNLNIEDVIKIIKHVQPKLVILTHFGVKMLKEDPLFLARDIHTQTGVQTIAAKDGMILTPQSYSAGLKTKTLNLYGAKSAGSQQSSPEPKQASPDKSDLPYL